MSADVETVTEQGEVVRLVGAHAIVQVRRAEACGHCAAAGACHAMTGSALRELTADNAIGAAVGDQVEIEVRAGVALRAVGWAYALPTVIVLVAAIGTYRLAAPRLSADGAGLVSVAASLAALGLYVLGAWLLGRRRGVARPAMPRVIRRV